MTEHDRALVLGPGGVVGTAWMAGLAHGLRHHGVDLAEADLIVGTSAGAIVGAILATGQDLGRLAAPSRPADSGGGPQGDPGLMARVFAVLNDPGLEPAEARREVGRLALAAPTISEEVQVARMAALIGAHEWPDRDLLIPAIDIETGEPRIWDRAGGAPLPAAVASSSAAPGAFPPITIGGRRYIDGAFRAGINADLAEGARALVIVEPFAPMAGRKPSGAVTITPDEAALESFGPDLHAFASWPQVFESGMRQAAEAAGRVAAVWNAAIR